MRKYPDVHWKEKSMNLDNTILIVDDEVVIRKIVTNFLTKAGYKNIQAAEDGEKALEVLKYNDIDLIIADWNMPNLNGIELLNRVRENVKWEKTPFIMLTAEAHESNVLTAGLNKTTDYIVKPFTAATLLKRVARALKSKIVKVNVTTIAT